MAEASALKDIEVVELQNIQNSIRQLYSKWEDLGLEIDQKVIRVQTTWSHVQSLIKDMCEEEAATCEGFKSQIKKNTEEIAELSKILGTEMPKFEGLSLVKKYALLKKEHNFLVELKERRLQKLDELLNLRKKYSLFLGLEEPNFCIKNVIPMTTDLEDLQQNLKKLVKDCNEKYEKYCQIKKEVTSILETSELVPESPLEEHLYAGKEPLSLSDDALKAIEEVLLKTRNRRSELEAEMKKLIDKLTTLWNRSDIKIDRKNEFLSSNLKCKVSTLQHVQNELAFFENEKKSDLKLFIDSAREELKIMWDKCGVSETDRNSFSLYYAADVTYDILVATESEVEKWKMYFEETKTILKKVEERNRLWELLTALDIKATEPSRFRNRGGNLLKEEKERNLQKSISSLEIDISKTIHAYEHVTGKKFLFLGEEYQATICKQWQELSNLKNASKQENFLKN